MEKRREFKLISFWQSPFTCDLSLDNNKSSQESVIIHNSCTEKTKKHVENIQIAYLASSDTVHVAMRLHLDP
jgi:hypothetical protein